MRKLRFCKRCGEVFEALGAGFGRVCDKCTKNKGGWHSASQKEVPFKIDNILGTHKWRFSKYYKEEEKKIV